MANPTTYSFKQIVANFVAGAQAASSQLINFSIGSVLRAIAQATSAVALWLQGLALTAIGLTRASTSTGADLDTWMADYGLVRIPGVSATGNVTFSRNVLGTSVFIAIGVQVQTADGSQLFTVVPDTTNVNYNAALGGYVIGALALSTLAAVVAVNATAATNVLAHTITQLVAAVPGVDAVDNALPFTGGADPETDAAFRARFVAYLGSLSRGTQAAIGYAISLLITPTQNIFYKLVENQVYADGTTQLGYFYAVIDDGTGGASGTLLSAVSTQIDLYRAFTIQFGVFAAAKVTANFSANILVSPGFDHQATILGVTAGLTSYINSLGIGATLPYSKLLQICYTAVPNGVALVSNAVLNGGNADVTCTAKQVVRAGTIGIS